MIDGEGAKDLTTLGQDWKGPARPKAMGEGKVAALVPQRIGADVGDDHRPPREGGGAAGPGGRADRDPVDGGIVLGGQAGSGSLPQMRFVRIEQKDGAAAPHHHGFGQMTDPLKHGLE
jgi:hypothetical protein